MTYPTDGTPEFAPMRMGQMIFTRTLYLDSPGTDSTLRKVAANELRDWAPEIRRVLDELSDPRWDFRTPASISIATGLTESTVRAILSESSSVRRPWGRPKADVFTREDRPVSWREVASLARGFVAKRF